MTPRTCENFYKILARSQEMMLVRPTFKITILIQKDVVVTKINFFSVPPSVGA